MRVRSGVPSDFPALRPMLLDMGFVEDEPALEVRFPDFCNGPAHALLVAETEKSEDIGYAALHDYGPHLRSGDAHRTAKLDDLYVSPGWRRRGVARLLMKAVEGWARGRPLRYVFWYANAGESSAAYRAMGYRPDDAGQEGFLFFEIDLGNPLIRTPHPERGS